MPSFNLRAYEVLINLDSEKVLEGMSDYDDFTVILPLLEESDPRVQEAKVRWEKDFPYASDVFMDVYQLFATCLGFREITAALGLGKSTVSWSLYTTYFQNLFGMNGGERGMYVQPERNRLEEVKKQRCEEQERICHAVNLKTDPVVKDVIAQAQAHGLVAVPQLVDPNGSKISEVTVIEINGKQCLLKRVTDVWKRGGKHWRCELFGSRLTQFDAVVLHIACSTPPRFYVVPTIELSSKVFNTPPDKKAIYVPISRTRNVRSSQWKGVDYPSFEGAWHLL